VLRMEAPVSGVGASPAGVPLGASGEKVRLLSNLRNIGHFLNLEGGPKHRGRRGENGDEVQGRRLSPLIEGGLDNISVERGLEWKEALLAQERSHEETQGGVTFYLANGEFDAGSLGLCFFLAVEFLSHTFLASFRIADTSA